MTLPRTTNSDRRSETTGDSKDRVEIVPNRPTAQWGSASVERTVACSPHHRQGAIRAAHRDAKQKSRSNWALPPSFSEANNTTRRGTTHMKVLAPAPSLFFATALIVSCLLLASCSTPTVRHSEADSDVVRIPESWKPHLLYLLPSPHSRLYVEVDAVEGSVPKQAALQKLRSFLSKYCNKPDGIEIVRGDVIPIETARGFSEKALARKYVNGPAKTTGSPPAFMYVLFYNDALCKESVEAEHSRASAAQRSRRAAKPYAEALPYPAIYFNTRYVPWFPWRFSGMDKKGLLHEAGHLLGLVRRPTGVSFHCTNRTCLLNSDVYLHRSLLGQQKMLCPQCAAELAESSTDPPPSNLRFVGAVLVRS